MDSPTNFDGVITNIKVTFQWDIPNFCSTCPGVKTLLLSPIFTHQESNLNFQLKLYPKGIRTEDKEYLSVYVGLLGNKKADVFYAMSFLTNENKQCYPTSARRKFNEDKNIRFWGCAQMAKQFDILNNRRKFLTDNKLRILCEITVHKVFNTDAQVCKRPRLDQSLLATTADGYNFEQFFISSQFSDVLFVTHEDKKIHAHKFILASKSEVFLALFENSKKQIINVNDIKHEVFIEMLRFIYTNKVNDLSKIARELLDCAEKYNLADLKLLCETSICDGVTTSTALDLVSYAETHKLIKLRTFIINFIVSNMKEIVNAAEFKSTAIRYPDICVEILQKCANKN